MDATGEATAFSVNCDGQAAGPDSCHMRDGDDVAVESSGFIKTLDVTSATVKEVRSFLFTQKFYTFDDANAVLALRLDNSLNASVAGKLHIFAKDVTAEGIARWLNNQHSDSIYIDTPSSVEVIDVGPVVVVEYKPGAVRDHYPHDEIYDQRFDAIIRIPESVGRRVVLPGFEDIVRIQVRRTVPAILRHFSLRIDVNGDNVVSSLDGLIIINDLNRYGPRAVPNQPLSDWTTDTNFDGYVSPTDVWTVFAELQYSRATNDLTVSEVVVASKLAFFEIDQGIGTTSSGNTFNIVGSFAVVLSHPEDNTSIAFQNVNVSFQEIEDSLRQGSPITATFPASTGLHDGHRFYSRTKYNLYSETDLNEESWTARLRDGVLSLSVIRSWVDGRQYSYTLTAKQVLGPSTPGA